MFKCKTNYSVIYRTEYGLTYITCYGKTLYLDKKKKFLFLISHFPVMLVLGFCRKLERVFCIKIHSNICYNNNIIEALNIVLYSKLILTTSYFID